MKVSISNQIKTIQLGDKGPNLLTVERQRSMIRELSLNDSKAIIILGNDQVFSAGLNLKDLTAATTKEEVGEIFSSLSNLLQSIRKFPGPVISVISGQMDHAGSSAVDQHNGNHPPLIHIKEPSFFCSPGF